MRILFIVPSLKCGGLERVASVLSNVWAHEDSVSLTLVALDSKKPFYKLDRSITVIQASANVDDGPSLWKALKKWYWLRRLVDRTSPSIVLSFGERYNAFIIGCLAGLRSSSGSYIPICVGNRTAPQTSLVGLRGLINPIAYRRTALVFVQTERAREMLRTRYQNVRMVVVPNPIPDPLASSEAHIDYRQKVIVNVGSFTGHKNQAALIRIFASLQAEFPDWRLVFAGAGPREEEARALANAVGLENRIAFLGNVEDIAQVHLKGSIFAFTSLLEGYPNALAEAMRSGLASVAFDCDTGPADMITHGETGFLVKLNADLDFAAQLRHLMADESLRKHVGTNARRQMSHLDPLEVARRYLTSLRCSASTLPG